MTTPIACPACGAALDLHEHVVVNEWYFPSFLVRGAPLPRRERVARAVAFCSGCEFVREIRVP